MSDSNSANEQATAIQERLDRIEHLLVAGRSTAHIPKDGHWTYKEFRVRFSLGINPHGLTDDELVDWLSDSRVMSRTAMYKLFRDETTPIRPLKLEGGNRVLEKHVRDYLRQAERQSLPRSLRQAA